MKLITEFHLLQGLYDHHELCGYCAVIVRLLCGASEYFLKILWKLNKKEIDCQLNSLFSFRFIFFIVLTSRTYYQRFVAKVI